MPAISAKSKVLVTGASGFIAAHVCRSLLEKGYTVVGSVRSNEKGEYLKKLYGSYTGRFSYVIVGDNEAPGAYDDVVKQGDFAGIAHTASPFYFNAKDPDELIGPAVKGTLSILEAVSKYGTGVKRLVVTSSTVAILSPDKPPGYTYTESDWNESAPVEVERLGRDAPGRIMYLASKTLAERAAWKYWEDEKNKKQGEAVWDLVTVLPPMVFGPTIHQIKDISALNTSIAVFRSSITDSTIHTDVAKTSEQRLNFVDVRDVADAHVLALEKDTAAGERFIVSNGPYSIQQFLDALNKAGVKDVPKGHPDGPENVRTVQSGEKAAKVLGLKYRPLQDTAVDMLTSLRERFPGST